MIPTVTFTATYECVYWPEPEDCDPHVWGGWCDPDNPWGTADDDIPFDDLVAIGGIRDYGEPITTELPIWQAGDFIASFPGAVWDWQNDCDPSENYRTGVSTRVTLHVAGPGADAALEIADRLRNQRNARQAAAIAAMRR